MSAFVSLAVTTLGKLRRKMKTSLTLNARNSQTRAARANLRPDLDSSFQALSYSNAGSSVTYSVHCGLLAKNYNIAVK